MKDYNYGADLDNYAGVTHDDYQPSTRKDSPSDGYNYGADLDNYVSGKSSKKAINKDRTIVDDVGRALGRTARIIAEKNPYTAIGGALSDLTAKGLNSAYGTGRDVYNSLTQPSGREGFSQESPDPFTMPSQDFSNALTDIGIAKPENGLERVIDGTAGTVLSAGGGIAAGNYLANSANPVVSGVGNTLASNPLSQLIAGGTGGAAAEYTREEGGSPLAQMGAGVVGSLIAPTSVAASENAFNRLIGGRENIAKNVADFAGAGAAPSVGQATQSAFSRNLESMLAKLPGSSNVMADFTSKQAAKIGDKIDNVSSSLSPRVTTTSAGRAIEKGISGESGFVDQFKKKANDLYSELDTHIPSDAQVPVSNTQKILSSLNSNIPGAENLSKLFKNPKIQDIENSLKKDLRSDDPMDLENAYLNAFPQSNVFNPSGKQAIQVPGTQKEGQFLPYESVKKLRTVVGKQLETNELVSQVPRSQWKALYGALSTDLGDAAAQTSPEATKAWSRANNFYKAGIDRIDLLNSVVNQKTPEKIYSAATSGTNEGATNLNAVMQSLPPEGKKVVTANMLKQMGKATAGNQDDSGSVFSTNTFLTNWNKLSPEAKQSYLSRQSYGQNFSNDIDSIAATASNLRDGSKFFSNPSGTAPANELIRAGLGFVSAPISVGSRILGANKLARYMTNPDTVDSMLNYNGFSLPGYSSPVVANQLLQNRNQ